MFIFRDKMFFNGFSREIPQENAKTSDFVSETSWGCVGLAVSLVVLSLKVLSQFGQGLAGWFLVPKLVFLEVFNEEGEVMWEFAWKTSLKYSKFWLPLLAGALTTYFTWIMVYLDSNVPGIQPPSPLSPKKYKVESGHVFHLNYVFSLLVGVMVFAYLLWKDVGIEF